MNIRRAEKKEYENVKAFYYELIDDMQGMKYHPKWQKGIYPAESELIAALENRELYICEESGKIDKHFRKMGLGKTLYQKVFSYAKEQGIPVVAEIDTVPYNETSL